MKDKTLLIGYVWVWVTFGLYILCSIMFPNKLSVTLFDVGFYLSLLICLGFYVVYYVYLGKKENKEKILKTLSKITNSASFTLVLNLVFVCMLLFGSIGFGISIENDKIVLTSPDTISSDAPVNEGFENLKTVVVVIAIIALFGTIPLAWISSKPKKAVSQ